MRMMRKVYKFHQGHVFIKLSVLLQKHHVILFNSVSQPELKRKISQCSDRTEILYLIIVIRQPKSSEHTPLTSSFIKPHGLHRPLA